MKSTIRAKLTYANVMASIAVFLLLGGASALAAAQLGKNSVGAKQLKRNAVTATKIKDGAVGTAKLDDGAVTAAKVDAASLRSLLAGAAPLPAAPAPTPSTPTPPADDVRVGIVRVAATLGGSEEEALADAPPVALLAAGPLSLYGKCIDAEGLVTAYVFAESAVDGMLLQGEEGVFDGSPSLDTTTPEPDRVVSAANAGVDETHFRGAPAALSAMAPGGVSILGGITVGAQNGEPDGANPVFGAGQVCLFSGQLVELSR